MTGSLSDPNFRIVFSRAADPRPCARNSTSTFKAFPAGVVPDCSLRSAQDGGAVVVEAAAVMDKKETADPGVFGLVVVVIVDQCGVVCGRNRAVKGALEEKIKPETMRMGFNTNERARTVVNRLIMVDGG